ncbi:MAG: universal stress protein [Candidatus Bathyarchaeia archaeon]
MAEDRILVPVDGSTSSLMAEETAAKIAKKIGATITILYVMKEFRLGYRLPRNIEEEIAGRVEQEAEKILSEARMLFMEEGVATESKIIRWRDPAESILEFSKDYDLIVIGAHGENEKDPTALGSVTKKVVRYAKKPVLIAKNVSMLSSILACVDGSEHAINALKYGIQLAEKMGSNITLLNVQEKKMFEYAPDIIKDLGGKILSKAAEAIGETQLKINEKMEVGVPSDVIVKVAEEGNYDLIIMGSRGLGKVKRFLFGSVSEDVSYKAKCSVLIVPAKVDKTF